MKRIYSALEIPVDEAELARSRSTPGRTCRKRRVRASSTAGGWREALIPTQVEVVERTSASLLERSYPERTESIDRDPYPPTRVQARQASKSRTTRTHSAVLHWCGALYDLGAATRADNTLWYASKVPEELLENPNT